jgi:hypothetical protein
VPIALRIKGWLRKKTNHRIIWDGDLVKRKLNLILIVIAAIAVMAAFVGLFHSWIDSANGLVRTYGASASIPKDLLSVIDNFLWFLVFSIGALVVLFITNIFKWRKATGLLFVAWLVLGMVLCVALTIFGLISMGQIHYVNGF